MDGLQSALAPSQWPCTPPSRLPASPLCRAAVARLQLGVCPPGPAGGSLCRPSGLVHHLVLTRGNPQSRAHRLSELPPSLAAQPTLGWGHPVVLGWATDSGGRQDSQGYSPATLLPLPRPDVLQLDLGPTLPVWHQSDPGDRPGCDLCP